MIYRVIMDGNDILNYQEQHFVLISPILNVEINTAGSFEFTMPHDHTFYDAVHPLLSSIEVYEDETLLWFGRPVETKVDFYNQKTVYCEGALAFFSDSIQRPHEYENASLHDFFEEVIASHNAQVAKERQIFVGNVTVADRLVYRKLNYENTFEVLKRMCVGAEGGYLFVRRENGRNYIDWLADMPYSCNQPVEFGLNLLDLSSDFDGSTIATCVIPLGDTDPESGAALTIASVNGGSDVLKSSAVSTFGGITKAVTFSGTKDAEMLCSQGQEYLQNSQFDDLVIKCSAAELHSQNENYEQFRVGQMIHCRSVPHLIDRDFPLTKMTIRLDTAAKQIELGNVATQSLSRIYKDAQAQDTNAVGNPATEAEIEDLRIDVSDLGSEVSGLRDLVDAIPAGAVTTGLKVASVPYLPGNPAQDTLYLIKYYTDYNNYP